MIYQIIGSDNAKTTEDFVRDWAPRLKGAIHLIFIEELFKLKRLPVGSFLFCDIERLDKEHRELLGDVVLVGGERRLDLAVRLETDEVQFRLVNDIDEAVDAVLPGSRNLEVLANYTAFQQYRTALGRVQ